MSSSIRSVTSALLIAVALPWAVTAPVEAAPSKSKAKSRKDLAAAKAAFGKGKKRFEAGRYKQAIVEYEKAYALSEMPAILFNIAQCHKKLEHWEQARAFFLRYLELSPRPIANEALARTLLEEVKAKLPSQQAASPDDGPALPGATAPAPQPEPAQLASAQPLSTAPSDGVAAQALSPSPSAPLANADSPATLVVTAPSADPGPARTDVVPAEALAAPVDDLREEGEGGVATKWWFWTAIGVVVAGGVTAAVVATRPAEPLAQTSLGEIKL